MAWCRQDQWLITDCLDYGWLPLKIIAIPSSPMVVSQKPLSIPSPQNFYHQTSLTYVRCSVGRRDEALIAFI